MASNSRRQIELWLKTIEVKGSVIDIGGLFMPVKGRTKAWDVNKYVIADIKPRRKSIETHFVWDFNYPLKVYDEFDNAFLIEVVDHLWNPVQAFKNIELCLKPGGLLYISSNFLFPHHIGFDCIRLTSDGLRKILEETGFKVINIQPRFAVDDTLEKAMRKESKVVYQPGVIGYMCVAQKI